MKHSLFLCLLILSATILHAQSDTADEMKIKNIMKQEELAWNKHDWESYSSHFTDDGTLINFVGLFWKSKNDILAHFKQLSDCCLSPTSLKFEIKNIKFLSPDIAIVYVEETLFIDKDYNTPFQSYKKGDTEYKMLTNIFVKDNSQWKIKAAQLTLINQIVSPHNASEKH